MAIEIVGFPMKKWWFSIAMGQFTRNYTFAPWKIKSCIPWIMVSHFVGFISVCCDFRTSTPFWWLPFGNQTWLAGNSPFSSIMLRTKPRIYSGLFSWLIFPYVPICLPSFLKFSPYPYFFSHFSHIWWLKMGWSKAPSPGTARLTSPLASPRRTPFLQARCGLRRVGCLFSHGFYRWWLHWMFFSIRENLEPWILPLH